MCSTCRPLMWVAAWRERVPSLPPSPAPLFAPQLTRIEALSRDSRQRAEAASGRMGLLDEAVKGHVAVRGGGVSCLGARGHKKHTRVVGAHGDVEETWRWGAVEGRGGRGSSGGREDETRS
jgi:hypothetical protein